MSLDYNKLQTHAAAAERLVTLSIVLSVVSGAGSGALLGLAVTRSGVVAVVSAGLLAGAAGVLATLGASLVRLFIQSCLAQGEAAKQAKRMNQHLYSLLGESRAGNSAATPTGAPQAGASPLPGDRDSASGPRRSSAERRPQSCIRCGGELVAGLCSNACDG